MGAGVMRMLFDEVSSLFAQTEQLLRFWLSIFAALPISHRLLTGRNWSPKKIKYRPFGVFI
jgi:hypothetical protein